MITSVNKRGLKRTCQDEACGVRFYDLNKATIACPVCGAAFKAPPAPVLREVTVKQEPQRRPYAKPFGASGRPAAASAPVAAVTGDGDEAVDEVAEEIDEEVDDISVEVDDAVDDKTESILELDDEIEDVEPVVPTDKDSE